VYLTLTIPLSFLLRSSFFVSSFYFSLSLSLSFLLCSVIVFSFSFSFFSLLLNVCPDVLVGCLRKVFFFFKYLNE
jgi:hypothetical protein